MKTMRLTVLFDREEDGRWIAEVPQLPGVVVYGDTREAALRRARALALETIAGLAELGETDIDDAIHFDAA
jgi:predicted RNase H-like HicB family nuclease